MFDDMINSRLSVGVYSDTTSSPRSSSQQPLSQQKQHQEPSNTQIAKVAEVRKQLIDQQETLINLLREKLSSAEEKIEELQQALAHPNAVRKPEIEPPALRPYRATSMKEYRILIGQTSLAFRMSPSYFPSDEVKILYVLLCLQGRALDCWIDIAQDTDLSSWSWADFSTWLRDIIPLRGERRRGSTDNGRTQPDWK